MDALQWWVMVMLATVGTMAWAIRKIYFDPPDLGRVGEVQSFRQYDQRQAERLEAYSKLLGAPMRPPLDHARIVPNVEPEGPKRGDGINV
jgi:hypothetical protein